MMATTSASATVNTSANPSCGGHKVKRGGNKTKTFDGFNQLLVIVRHHIYLYLYEMIQLASQLLWNQTKYKHQTIIIESDKIQTSNI